MTGDSRNAELDQLRHELVGTAESIVAGVHPGDDVVKSAVRSVLKALTLAHPGKAAELRVAPYGAVQLLGGHVHRRGTPPTVVSLTPVTLLGLFTGMLGVEAAAGAARSSVSGSRGNDVLEVIAAGSREAQQEPDGRSS